MTADPRRRLFLSSAVATGAGLLGAAALAEPTRAKPSAPEKKPAEVNATEDLMREHGVLRRVLLVYGEAIRRSRTGSPPPADTFAGAAEIIRDFIEGYHEKLEEEQVFPRMEKAGKLAELVSVLKAQHEAGKKLTRTILEQATAGSIKSRPQTEAITSAAEQFCRMYEPHAAREDTVLFPAFHLLFTEKEFDALGEKFEEKEHQLLGGAGFEGSLEKVSHLERALGIEDLAQFTPK